MRADENHYWISFYGRHSMEGYPIKILPLPVDLKAGRLLQGDRSASLIRDLYGSRDDVQVLQNAVIERNRQTGGRIIQAQNQRLSLCFFRVNGRESRYGVFSWQQFIGVIFVELSIIFPYSLCLHIHLLVLTSFLTT